MGFKNLTLASSSLSDCHAPLVETHFARAWFFRIYTSGLRGPLAEEISRGLLAEPVQESTLHGGRVVWSERQLNIDVAFLGVPSCDDSVMPTATPVKPAAAPSAMQWLMPTTQNRL